MNIYRCLILLCVGVLLAAGNGVAAEFTVESVAIRKSPLKGDYYMYFEVSFKDKSAATKEPSYESELCRTGNQI